MDPAGPAPIPGQRAADVAVGDSPPFVRPRLPLIACVCVLGLAVAAAGVGVSAYRSMRLQAEYGRASFTLAEISSLAGRMDALVAALADPRSDPAQYPAMRAELRGGSSRLAGIGRLFCSAGDRETAATPQVQKILCTAITQAQPELVDFVKDYAATGVQAARPKAQLAPGMLVRGNLDGLYVNLVQAVDKAETVVQHEQARSLRHWRTLVVTAVIALLGLAGTLSALIIGPLAALVHRNRIREQAALQSRLQTAAYISQVIESIDVGVVAVDGAGRCVTLNSAARTMLDVDGGDDPVSRPGQLWLPDAQVPLDDDSMPLNQALAGRPFPATELRLLPGRSPVPGPRAEHDAPERRVVVRALPLSTHDGRSMGALATFLDVTELHVTNGLLARRASELAALSEATRAVMRDDDARDAACQAAAAISGAVMAGLFEPDEDGDLVCSSASRADVTGLRFGRSNSVMGAVFAAGRSRTTADVHENGDASLETVRHLSRVTGRDVLGVAWIPVITAGRCLAVLALAFADRIDAAAHLPILEILAAETAGAIERQDLLNRLAIEAETDPLTGAANRRAWEAALSAALDETSNAGRVSVVMLDLDHFKTYNDTYGHPAGDILLRDAANAWRGRIRSHDLLARYGGEEFMILLTDCDLPQAVAVADSLRGIIPDGQTCSAGVTSWDGREAPADLIARADAALYSAKRAGRNRTVTAS